ncbi:MAG: hypothetical protein FJ271_00025 [Planctomycetes bacterium]|nr:hypothetical protein [Planctomycetota bacterium]
MLPLYHDPCFTFRFADDRIIPRFHLEGVEAGRRVSVIKIDAATGKRQEVHVHRMGASSRPSALGGIRAPRFILPARKLPSALKMATSRS